MKVKETITLKWKKQGQSYLKEINRKNFLETMEGIKKGYPDNNEISTKLCQIIPNVISFEIDFDRNGDLSESPIVAYETSSGTAIIRIKNCHKIIWTILKEHCKL